MLALASIAAISLSAGAFATANAQKAATSKSSAVSACKGLSRSACGGNTACTWVQPKKATDVRGRKLSAYCRKAPKRKTN